VEFNAVMEGNIGEGSGREETDRTDKIIRTDEYKDKMVKDFIGYDSLKKRADLLQQRVEQRKFTELGIEEEKQLAERDNFGNQWAGGVQDELFDEQMNKVQQPFETGLQPVREFSNKPPRVTSDEFNVSIREHHAMIDRNIKEFGKEWAVPGTEAYKKHQYKYGDQHKFIPPPPKPKP